MEASAATSCQPIISDEDQILDDHLSFANPSPNPTPRSLPPGSELEEFSGVEYTSDPQGTEFVETTSLQAAKALAKVYNEKGEKHSYVVKSRVIDGKTIYRIRPRSPPPLEQSTSRQGLRSVPDSQPIPSVAIIHRDAHGFYRPPGSDFPMQHSTPTRILLSKTGLANGNGKVKYGVEDDGDVLGKILGWTSAVSAATNSRRLHTKETGEQDAKRTSKHVNRSNDSTIDDNTSENKISRPPMLSRTTITSRRFISYDQAADGPLGPDVKVGDNQVVRETGSFESIKTAKGENDTDVEDARDVKRRQRKKEDDPTVFDIFHSPSISENATTPLQDPTYNGTLKTEVAPISSSIASTELRPSFYPGNDPRFVIWGTKGDPKETLLSGSHGVLDAGQEASVSNRRWSLKKASNSPDLSTISIQPLAVLMAATLERVVAEITSKMNSDLLTEWFLTYRLVTTPLDLLKLFILRFRWAMMEPSSPENDSARRIARVRTFVVIRHWLLNFFAEDFLPNKDVRSTLTEWLNEVAKDEYIQHNPKDQHLIKGLKKIVKRLKEMYTLLAPSTDTLQFVNDQSTSVLGQLNDNKGEWEGNSESGQSSSASRRQSLNSDRGSETGDNGSEEVEVLSGMGRDTDGSDEEVDLEIDVAKNTKTHSLDLSVKEPFDSNDSQAASPPLAAKLSSSVTTRPTSVAVLNHVDHRRRRSSESDSPSSTVFRNSPIAGQPTLPFTHSGFSRYLDRTMGTFGRVRRLLGNRTSPNTVVACVNLDAIDDAEIGRAQTGDLLYSKNALDAYFRFFLQQNNSNTLQPAPESTLSSSNYQTPISDSENRPSFNTASISPNNTGKVEKITKSVNNATTLQIASDEDKKQATSPSALNVLNPGLQPPELHHSISTQTIKSEFSREKRITDRVTSLKIPGFAAKGTHQSIQSAVQLDDLDLSDDSEPHAPIKKTLRRLPGANNLRTVGILKDLDHTTTRDSVDTFSSFGTQEGIRLEATTSIVASEDGESQGMPVFDAGNFILEGIDSDDSEGDVEAALRRLEGHIDEKKQRNKLRTVDRQMEKSMRAAICSTSETDLEETASSIATDDSCSASRAGSIESNEPVVVVPEPTSSQQPQSRNSNQPGTASNGDEQGMTGDDIHETNMHKSLTFKVSSSMHIHSPVGRASFGPLPPVHRSFILLHRTEIIAQQFCLIERDLFRAVQWRELVAGLWQNRKATGEVLDWELYLKSQRLRAMDAKSKGQESTQNDVQAMIARFNVVANWVASEIVLTINLDQRAALVAKFIRLAWKCYTQYNFQSVTQIVHGLQTTPVERLRRTWRHVPKWEMGVYHDLKTFTSHLRNFKGLRTTTCKIAEEWGPLGSQRAKGRTSRSSTNVSSSKPKHTRLGCIPFFGIFLRDLAVNFELPTFLDPTSPGHPANIDPTTGQLLRVADPGAFSDLPALPPGVALDPLINIHKLRNLATVIQNVLAFQEMAEVYPFEADGLLYITCLKLKCLDVKRLRECSEICER